MGRASIDQTSFLGGEWGALSYGRSDDPKYTQAMQLCLNGYACEEGSWLKRSGTLFIVPTYQSAYANILPFYGSETCSFAMEFTDPVPGSDGFLRLLTQSSLVFTNDAVTITAADTGTGNLTLSGAVDWANGDQVQLVFPDPSSPLYPYPISDEIGLRNQVISIGVVDTTHINLGVEILASTNLVGAYVMRVLRFSTPYKGGNAQIQGLRSVQAEINNIILSGTAPLQELQITTQGTLTSDPVFSFGPVTMIDGPYLDPEGTTLSLSGTSGTITLTAGASVFAATDVGRSVRIFTQPPIYNPASTYTTGENVTDSNGAWWTALQAVGAGQAPGQAAVVSGVTTVVWAPAPTAGSWAWGLITAYTNGTTVTFAFDTTIPNMVLQSGNGTTAYIWQLGTYSGTTGYPTCGVFYEGRLWLGGAVLNRFDTTTSNGVSQEIGTSTATFSPTDPYGNVVDSNGISLTLNSTGLNLIQWMIGDGSGVLMGTLSGETLVSASQLGDPITPTSIQAHEITRYGSENIEAVRAGMTVVFAQKFGRRIMEYLDDTLSQKFSGRHLNEMSKHITVSGVQRLAYQEEPIPTVWALMNNGLLAGATYRRYSRFVSQPPEMSAWHWHQHGGNKVFTSMCSVPGKNGLLDRLFLVTNDPPPTPGTVVTNYAIEVMQPPFDPSNSIYEGWFVDESSGPGPGNSGYDCGGGNPSGFFTTGGYRGADSTTATPPAFLTAFQNMPLGQSPPGGVKLILNEATYFPGSVGLYNIPRYPAGSPADEQSLSVSFWMGTLDLLNQGGAIIGSPAISYADSITGIQSVSAITAGGGGVGASMFDSIGDGIHGAFAIADITGAVNLNDWTHVMISAKDTGSGGTITYTVVINDTVVAHNLTQGNVNGNVNKMWQFLTQHDRQQPFGLACWCVGGQLVCPPDFTFTFNSSAGPVTTITIPPLAALLSPNSPIQGLRLALGSGGAPLIGPAPTPLQIYQELYTGHSYSIQSTLTTETVTGGAGNLPQTGGQGQVSGFIGSVAELWVKPGSYIDWTDGPTRLKFHEYDTISDMYGPVPLGVNGTGPGLGTPWLYLSGPPRFFPLNNANGQYLTEYDSSSGIIDFDAGLSGGLQPSPLNPPGQS